ncbi:type VII secretion-associated serine protease mycosin [Micromonospora sp. NPDC049559]|uniref:type VII secretion-associated serine protease mycosin n=1 Tax=Micromonospora sp. NPDC049559 TaxID=3155923 RepID=UPI00342595F8
MSLRAIKTAVAVLTATAVAVLPAGPAQADRIRDDQWHLRYLRVAEAHKISQGEGVTVAVIDTGVDPHPDLRNNLLQGTDVIAGGRGNGQGDTDSHGTGMAGIIAAHGHGNSGALGIAPQAKILPIRDETSSQAGNADNIAQGINYAVSHGARVINISSSSGPSPSLDKAVTAAVRADVLIVAGAGNKPRDFGVTFPAFLPGVLAVSATDRNSNLSNVSVTGRKIAIAAPGTDIYTTRPNGAYRAGTGTSDSAAIVSGAAALVRSKYPNLSAQEVVHRLTATAVDKGAPGRDEEYGYGILDLVAALTADVPPLATGTPSADPSPAESDPVAAPPRQPSNGSGDTLLLVAGLLLVVALAIGLLVVLSHRRRRAAGAGRVTGSAGSGGGPAAGGTDG